MTTLEKQKKKEVIQSHNKFGRKLNHPKVKAHLVHVMSNHKDVKLNINSIKVL